jgi:type II secretory pathway component PulM
VGRKILLLVLVILALFGLYLMGKAIFESIARVEENLARVEKNLAWIKEGGSNERFEIGIEN